MLLSNPCSVKRDIKTLSVLFLIYSIFYAANISALVISNTISTGAGSYTWTTLQNSTLIYTDRNYVYDQFPNPWRNLDVLQTANNDKYLNNQNAISFHVDEPVTVYVLYDSRHTALPIWLRGFSSSPVVVVGNFQSLGPFPFKIYQRDFPAGNIVLGGNNAVGAANSDTNYTVVVEPIRKIDPTSTGDHFIWGENIGWINFKPSLGPGVSVSSNSLSGFAWGENIGWINMSPTLGPGVRNDGDGNLSGYAWAENIGWINFAPSGGGVWINACGEFNGYAWAENAGWINFRSDIAPQFKLVTNWRAPVDVVPPVSIDNAPDGWQRNNTSVHLSATDCGAGVSNIVYAINGGAPQTLPANGIVNFTSDGLYTLTYYATDVEGNIEAQNTTTILIDKTAPTIHINSPTNGAVYKINSNVAANYSISDNLSGVTRTSATVASGENIDTSSFGTKSFSVSAWDAANNTNTLTFTYSVISSGNIDSNNSGEHFAWSENAGWINFKPSFGPGITVTGTAVSGFAWGENIGWINLNPTLGGGVKNDGKGNLYGFAWAENAGWINFNGVSISDAGRFGGFAWGENIGWINFDSKGIVSDWKAPAKSSYCTVQANISNYEFINSVQIANSVNSSGNNNGYLDSTQNPILTSFGSNNLVLTPGFSSQTYSENWGVWIDFDKDGVFSAGEKVYSGTSSSVINTTINVPKTAFSGKTRMRVVMIWGVTPTSCGTFTYGEAEDYSINIR